MHVGDVKHRESIKQRRKVCQLNDVVSNLYAFCVLVATAVQTRQFERNSEDGVCRIPVLRVKEVDAVPEYVLMIYRSTLSRS